MRTGTRSEISDSAAHRRQGVIGVVCHDLTDCTRSEKCWERILSVEAVRNPCGQFDSRKLPAAAAAAVPERILLAVRLSTIVIIH